MTRACWAARKASRASCSASRAVMTCSRNVAHLACAVARSVASRCTSAQASASADAAVLAAVAACPARTSASALPAVPARARAVPLPVEGGAGVVDRLTPPGGSGPPPAVARSPLPPRGRYRARRVASHPAAVVVVQSDAPNRVSGSWAATTRTVVAPAHDRARSCPQVGDRLRARRPVHRGTQVDHRSGSASNAAMVCRADRPRRCRSATAVARTAPAWAAAAALSGVPGRRETRDGVAFQPVHVVDELGQRLRRGRAPVDPVAQHLGGNPTQHVLGPCQVGGQTLLLLGRAT